MQLFNGRNLDGWIVTGCEAEVSDGVLRVKSGDGLVRTHHRYADFVLELQWRALREDRWDSGIYVRAEAPPPGKPWPPRYQVNLLKGQEGSLTGISDEVVKKTAKQASKLVSARDWNRFKLTVVCGTAELEVNGQKAWRVKGIEAPTGYIGLQAEVDGGGMFEFKDIYVTELGYRPLFNGSDLSGWEGAGSDADKCWQAADGTLMCTGQRGTWLRSKERFGDFNLRLEYLLRPGGNSGVYVRVPPAGTHHGEGAGLEVQVLDDAAERYKNLQPYQFTGSLYAIVAAEPRVARPAGQWNTLEINCCGTHYRVVHNGVAVVDANGEQYPELKKRLLEGFLGLQNHSEEVRYRHLRLGPPLPGSK